MDMLLCERSILDSLQVRKRTISELVTDVGLPKKIVLNVLRLFLDEDLIEFDGNYYLLKTGKVKDLTMAEIEDSIVSLLNQKNDYTNFKYLKVNLDSFEEKLLDIHLKNLFDFFYNVEINNQKKLHKAQGKTKDKKVIFWAFGNYGDLINRSTCH